MAERIDYGAYLASREWALLKEQLLARSSGVCERCFNAPYQETHHKTYARIGHEPLEDLLAVCSACHRYLSAKSDVDPAIRRVYLAGKIVYKDWRHGLFPDLRDASLDEYWQEPAIVRDGFQYNGPYFISCDHGCMHGSGTHGVASYAAEINKGWPPPKDHGRLYECLPGIGRPEIMKRCQEWLSTSDVVFCWIDQPDAFGTLVELGMAKVLGIPVFLWFSDMELKEQMWFAAETADSWGIRTTFQDAWDAFVMMPRRVLRGT